MSENRGKHRCKPLNGLLYTLLVIYTTDYLWMTSEAAVLEGNSSYVGVVGSNLTLTWKFTYKTIPDFVDFFVATDLNQLKKTWTLLWSKSKYNKEKISLNQGSAEYIFSDRTDVKYKIQPDSSFIEFYYIINSVPKNVTGYYFMCRVKEDKWTKHDKTATVLLEVPPTVNFTIENNAGHIKRGSQVLMVCKSTGFPTPQVNLYKEVDSKLIYIGHSSQNLNHSIPNVQPSDAGKYVCIARNSAGNAKQSATFTVTYIEKSGSASNALQAKLEDTLALQCKINGFPQPTFTWYKNNKELNESSNKLNLKFEDASHFGIYTCKGMNYAGDESISYSVSEIYSPTVTFTIAKNEDHVKIGSQVHMVCKSSGLPIPNVFLYKEVDSKLINVGDSVQNLTYSISNVQPSDAGKYICIARNKAGEVKKSATVTVAFIKILTAEFVFQLKTGEQKQLDCPIQGSPEAVISWYKTNKKISGSKMLVIKLDNKDKFGNYTCVGENKAGKQTAVFSLQESSSNNKKNISPTVKGGKRIDSGSWKTKLSYSVALLSTIIACILRNYL